MLNELLSIVMASIAKSRERELISKIEVQLTPDNSNLQGKLKRVRGIGRSSYRG